VGKTNVEKQCGAWYVDSSATRVMTPYRNIINKYTELASGEVNIADGSLLQVLGKGSVTMKVRERNGGWTLRLENVLYVPNLKDNLLSKQYMDQKECGVETSNGCKIL
jgi:hypothetical protein